MACCGFLFAYVIIIIVIMTRFIFSWCYPCIYHLGLFSGEYIAKSIRLQPSFTAAFYNIQYKKKYFRRKLKHQQICKLPCGITVLRTIQPRRTYLFLIPTHFTYSGGMEGW